MPDRSTRPDVDAALAIIRAHAPPLDRESVPVAEAGGRIVAIAATAMIAVPRFRVSAMDGFAIASGDAARASVDRPVELRIFARTGAAGDMAEEIPNGWVCPIATGAPVPAGADAVIAKERADTALPGLLRISGPIEPNLNVRAVGEDVAAGTTMLAPGETVSPAAVGLLAAAGVTHLAVRRRPRTRLVVTGSELAADALALEHPARIPDSNGPMLAACLRELGLRSVHNDSVPDDLDRIEAAIADHDADLVLSTGGASVGDRDLIAAALDRIGATIHFNGVAMRPGKPILFATLPDGRPFLGLPGNPVAALVGFRFFAVALLRAMHGASPEHGTPLTGDFPRRAGTTLFLRGRMVHDGRGVLGVALAPDQRSHILSSAVASNCWVRAEGDPSRPATLFGDRARLGDSSGQNQPGLATQSSLPS